VDPAGYGPAQEQPPITARAGAPVPGNGVSRGRTIGLIVAGVVGVGVLGALGGVLLGGDNEGTVPASPASPTDAATVGSDAGASAVLDEPAATARSGGAEKEAAETGAAVTARGLATDELTPDNSGAGTATLEPGVDVHVPDGWTVVGQSETDLLQTNGSTWVYAVTGTANPAGEASAAIQELAPDLLPTSTYTQFENGEITPVQPDGSIVSMAFIDYVAVYVDAQSSAPIYGRLIVAIRQDGVLLAMTIESSPAEAFNDDQPPWSPIPGATFGAFAGV
jgi:hypothetical protein